MDSSDATKAAMVSFELPHIFVTTGITAAGVTDDSADLSVGNPWTSGLIYYLLSDNGKREECDRAEDCKHAFCIINGLKITLTDQ
jgi:hypothetical protein